MNVGFVFTNFNNSSYTENAIISLFPPCEISDIVVVIVDNNSHSSDVDSLKRIKSNYPQINFIFNKVNVGYFNGLNIGINFIRINYPDIKHIVVGNNDLVFPKEFVKSIDTHAEIFNSFAVISPDLITLDGIHQNPHVISDISIFREFIWDLYYSNYYLSTVLSYIGKITKDYTKRIDYQEFDIARPIAQGYGACYILGPIFFDNYDRLWSPTLIMGEEFFLSQQLLRKGLCVYYYPIFKVFHHDHATIDKIHTKKLWKYSQIAHRIYRLFVRPFWYFGLKKSLILTKLSND
jgi:GT2 family glycosyltransferase